MPDWTQEDMDRAISVIEDGEMGHREATDKYHVPRTTLLRHLNNPNLKKTRQQKSIRLGYRAFTSI